MPAGQRPSSATALPESTNPDAAPAATRKYAWPNPGFFFSFDLPPTPEALAVRIRKNLTNLAGSYLLVWWVGLAISLVPRWRTSDQILLLMILVLHSSVAQGMLKLDTKFTHRASVVAIVLFALAVASTVTLIFIEAKIHLLLSLAIGVPGVLLHAILWRDDLKSTTIG
ncbi:hypothetical protein MLD38_036614 [Melastoma candidum]|uniref:Uncharacterized protein n=1 Tax=Melastoma candidum TaxID=119954 RepID=A0ACB9LJR8_9MYRT|nr:hypothetical protein MLD38_036614 [Melastoma candidum]